jgi:hypothetical protein
VQNPASKHHYVPIFYSKRWADDAGEVVRFTVENCRLIDRRVHPARVGWQRDLYRIPGETGDASQRLETLFFSQLDGNAADVLRKLLSTPIKYLNDLDVGHWSMFIRSLMLRSPENLASYQGRGLTVWRGVVRGAADKYMDVRTDDDPPTHAEYVATRTITEGRAHVLETLPHLLASSGVLERLARAPWQRYDVPPSAPALLLSDAPIVRTNGFDIPDGHIAMPLSPRRFLLIARDADTAARLDRIPVKVMVKGLNRSVVSQARRFVVAHDLSQARFIEKHFATGANASRP